MRQWWAGLVADFVKNGVDGIWNDMNEPSVFNVRHPHEVVLSKFILFLRVPFLFGAVIVYKGCVLFQTVSKTMPDGNLHRGDPGMGGKQTHLHYHNVGPTCPSYHTILSLHPQLCAVWCPGVRNADGASHLGGHESCPPG